MILQPRVGCFPATSPPLPFVKCTHPGSARDFPGPYSRTRRDQKLSDNSRRSRARKSARRILHDCQAPVLYVGPQGDRGAKRPGVVIQRFLKIPA